MKHIHQYKRVNISRDKTKKYLVYRCVLPNCSHYMPNENLIVGKQSLCFKCKGPFVISTKKFSKAVCDNCKNKREKTTNVENILKDIGVI